MEWKNTETLKCISKNTHAHIVYVPQLSLLETDGHIKLLIIHFD